MHTIENKNIFLSPSTSGAIVFIPASAAMVCVYNDLYFFYDHSVNDVSYS